MEYTISYIAKNTYELPVREAIYELAVIPANTDRQHTFYRKLENSLQQTGSRHTNLFGFDFWRLATKKTFTEIEFVMQAKVHVDPFNPFDFASPKRNVTDASMNDVSFIIDHHLFLRQTPYTSLRDVTSDVLPLLRNDEPLFEYLTSLNHFIHSHFTYQSNVTTVKSTAEDFIKLGKGVCQDFAHVFIGICRSQGIPARYVSGYLDQGHGYVGSALMHAWVEVYLPTIGWMGFDPTNNLLINENYIKVSHGADYKDCSPIKGILFTNGENTTSYQVKVQSNQ